MQNMIDDDLGMSIRQIGRLLGNIDWLVRKIVKVKIGYKSYIHRRCQFISIVMKQKRMDCRAHMKHVWDTNLWLINFLGLNPLDYFV